MNLGSSLQARIETWYVNYANNGPKSFTDYLYSLVAYPLSIVYSQIQALRSLLYSIGILKSCHSDLPVISVGNITMGGTGKTPFVDYLLHHYEGKGIKCAVISRGYGGSFTGSVGKVSLGEGVLMKPDVSGDEPYLLAKKHPKAVVLISPKRKYAIEYINSQSLADVIILDDAFQHQQVARDLDIVLVDAKRPLGNGSVFPNGFLREGRSALNRADLLVVTRADETTKLFEFDIKPLIMYSAHSLDRVLSSIEGEHIYPQTLEGKTGVAFAGIAKPASFFDSLSALGLTIVETIPLPDHAQYDESEIAAIKGLNVEFDYYVTTEKDAVKLTSANLAKPVYIAKVQIECIDEQPLQKALNKLVTEN